MYWGARSSADTRMRNKKQLRRARDVIAGRPDANLSRVPNVAPLLLFSSVFVSNIDWGKERELAGQRCQFVIIVWRSNLFWDIVKGLLIIRLTKRSKPHHSYRHPDSPHYFIHQLAGAGEYPPTGLQRGSRKCMSATTGSSVKNALQRLVRVAKTTLSLA
eukprot:1326052-Amorphochlora_amoeboformis.AAC.1